jgi:hypothetical protein
MNKTEKHWFYYVNLLRFGNFNDKDFEVKNAWYDFCENILVFVNKNWRTKAIRANSYLSDVCTVSDEAYAYQVARTNMHFWMKKMYYRDSCKIHTRKVAESEWEEIEPFSYDKNGQRVQEDTVSHRKLPGKKKFTGEEDEEVYGDEDDNEDGNEERIGLVNSKEDNEEEEGEDEDELNEVQMVKRISARNINQDASKSEGGLIDLDLEHKSKDKIDKQAYYLCYSILLNAKRTSKEDWMSWDKGFKACIGRKIYLQKGRSSTSSTISSKSKDSVEEDTVDVDFEAW